MRISSSLFFKSLNLRREGEATLWTCGHGKGKKREGSMFHTFPSGEGKEKKKKTSSGREQGRRKGISGIEISLLRKKERRKKKKKSFTNKLFNYFLPLGLSEKRKRKGATCRSQTRGPQLMRKKGRENGRRAPRRAFLLSNRSQSKRDRGKEKRGWSRSQMNEGEETRKVA